MLGFCIHNWEEVAREIGNGHIVTNAMTMKQVMVDSPMTFITKKCSKCEKYRQSHLKGRIPA